jgi:hypothetical protein
MTKKNTASKKVKAVRKKGPYRAERTSYGFDVIGPGLPKGAPDPFGFPPINTNLPLFGIALAKMLNHVHAVAVRQSATEVTGEAMPVRVVITRDSDVKGRSKATGSLAKPRTAPRNSAGRKASPKPSKN